MQLIYIFILVLFASVSYTQGLGAANNVNNLSSGVTVTDLEVNDVVNRGTESEIRIFGYMPHSCSVFDGASIEVNDIGKEIIIEIHESLLKGLNCAMVVQDFEYEVKTPTDLKVGTYTVSIKDQPAVSNEKLRVIEPDDLSSVEYYGYFKVDRALLSRDPSGRTYLDIYGEKVAKEPNCLRPVSPQITTSNGVLMIRPMVASYAGHRCDVPGSNTDDIHQTIDMSSYLSADVSGVKVKGLDSVISVPIE